MARLVLALNGGWLYKVGDAVTVKMPCAWPHYRNYRNPSKKIPLIAWPEVGVKEGLFWVLEKEPWNYLYTAVWRAAASSV